MRWTVQQAISGTHRIMTLERQHMLHPATVTDRQGITVSSGKKLVLLVLLRAVQQQLSYLCCGAANIISVLLCSDHWLLRGHQSCRSAPADGYKGHYLRVV